ncbi:hypothetical protein C1Y63_06600 [Corynebacterium sp. 13CS0277]|nr:hypothetical protein C1Y63_06600 [Corynebacterium sp. 13CS0277]
MLRNPHDARLKPSAVPAWAQYAGIVLLGIGFAASSVWALTDHWRRATFALGVTMLWLTCLRLSCDSRILGVLAVRSRKFDCTFTTTLGGLLVFFALSVDSLGSG